MDISVFGPLKGYVNSTADRWMRSHPGSNITIYDVPSIVAEALPEAATVKNITSGFSSPGIWPFKPSAFQEKDLARSYATDCPPPQASSYIIQSYVYIVVFTFNKKNVYFGRHEPGQGPEPDEAVRSEGEIEFSPEIVRPYPETGPRKIFSCLPLSIM